MQQIDQRKRKEGKFMKNTVERGKMEGKRKERSKTERKEKGSEKEHIEKGMWDGREEREERD